MTSKTVKRPLLVLWLIIAWALAGMPAAQAAHDPFPNYPEIEPNVNFWLKIYTEYPSTTALIHDSRQLDIVYEVIELKPADQTGARKINRKRIKRAKHRYRQRLLHLWRHPNDQHPESLRIAAIFGHPENPKIYRRAAGRLRGQIGQKDRFAAGLVRSGAWLEKIKEVFRNEGLPEDLAYLPHVESSFNPKAYSKFGAAGIWQFTRSTGRRFMRVGYVLDERRDPLRATHGAAGLLKENYAKLGSWPLAITAYNHGAAGMARAKRQFGSYPLIVKKYRGRTFKFASRNFYAEFLAARRAAKQHEHYFGQLVLNAPSTTRTVTLHGYAALDDLSTHYGVSMATLQQLNPALRPPVFSGQKYVPKGYALRLPGSQDADNAVVLASFPNQHYKDRQKPSRFYTVRRGDTAGRIARLHGIRLQELILANHLGRRATIYPRQTLRIPLPGEHQRPVPVETVTVASREPVPEKFPKPMLASIIPLPFAEPIAGISKAETNAPPAEPPVSDTDSARIPVSEPGVDSDSSVDAVLSPEIITVDIEVRQIRQINGRTVGTVNVQVEETLGHLADWLGIRTQTLRRLNKLRFGRTLHLHQKVRIPLDRVGAKAFEEKRYEYHKRLQEDFFDAYRVAGTQPYRVQRGDSYWTLCQDRFDVPLWLMERANPDVDFGNLRAREQIQVPVIEKREEPDAT